MTGDPAIAPALEPRTRLGAYALCVDPDARILLCRIREDTPDDGKWTLPGGGVEWGEHPDEAVLRELHEETGLHGTPREVAGIYSQAYPASVTVSGRDVHLVGILYRMTAVVGDLRDEIGGTTDTCAWFPLAEAGTLPLVPLAAYGLRLAAEPPTP